MSAVISAKLHDRKILAAIAALETYLHAEYSMPVAGQPILTANTWSSAPWRNQGHEVGGLRKSPPFQEAPQRVQLSQWKTVS